MDLQEGKKGLSVKKFVIYLREEYREIVCEGCIEAPSGGGGSAREGELLVVCPSSAFRF